MPELSLFETDAISRVGVYDQIKSLQITRKLRRPNTFRLEIASQTPRYEEITKGRYIGLSDISTQTINRIMRIDQLERSTSSDSVIVTGRDFAGWFDTRVCYPPTGQSHHSFTDIPAETVIKALVTKNAADPVTHPNRAFPNLVIEADQARGALVTAQARFQALSDMLEEVLLFDGGGYQVVYVPGPTNMHRFEYISPTDRTASVFLDLEFESVSEQSWIQSDIDMRNHLYVAGQGEGVNRTLVEVYEGAVPAGLFRREAFVDARDLNNVAAMTDRGLSLLTQMAEDNRFSATISERGSFRYGRDFFLGDIVTVHNRKWNLDVSARIISATLNWADTEQPSVTVEIARPWPTIKERMSQEAYGISQVAPKGAVDYHSENHAARHAPGAADPLAGVHFLTTPQSIDTATGFYFTNIVANMPRTDAGWTWFLIHMKYPGTGVPTAYGYQIANALQEPDRLWFRRLYAGTWSGWIELPKPDAALTWTALQTFSGANNPRWGSNGNRSEMLTDFNVAGNLPSGFYSVSTATNAPFPGAWWNLFWLKYAASSQVGTDLYGHQIASTMFPPFRTFNRHISNGVWGAWEEVGQFPYGRFTASVDQSIPNAAWTKVNWTGETNDAWNMRNPASPGDFTIPEAGIYILHVQLAWVIAAGVRYTGLPWNVFVDQPTSDPPEIQHLNVVPMAAGQAFSIQVYQNSGAALNLSGAWGQFLTVTKVSKFN